MIYYLVPESNTPSWGLAILYNHVRLLLRNGIEACIVKEGQQQAPDWMHVEVKYYTVGNFRKEVQANDIVVIPEVMINFLGLKKIRAKKIMFLQNAGLLFHGIPLGETHISLGIVDTWIIMPHMKAIIEQHVHLPFTIVPPYVAPYFHVNEHGRERKKQVLLYPKYEQVDYSVVKHIIQMHANRSRQPLVKHLFANSNWIIKEIKNLNHREVADLMRESAYFVSLNLFEALNTSVVEAMAAGCVVFCYEGFGPRDYLKDKKNAFVFPNNEAYKLAEVVCEWMDKYDESRDALNDIRKHAANTAAVYSEKNTENALLKYFSASS